MCIIYLCVDVDMVVVVEVVCSVGCSVGCMYFYVQSGLSVSATSYVRIIYLVASVVVAEHIPYIISTYIARSCGLWAVAHDVVASCHNHSNTSIM